MAYAACQAGTRLTGKKLSLCRRSLLVQLHQHDKTSKSKQELAGDSRQDAY